MSTTFSHGAGQPDMGDLRRLREEIGTLVRDLPGAVSKVSARVGDSALEITWMDARIEPSAAPRPAGPVPEPEPDQARTVVAPLVGTLYRAPEPHAPPFVEVGDQVVAGQTLAIIESMKLMNHIESEWDGTVVEICVANGCAVEFGQPLVRIEPVEGGD
jgi:acetyl-CoA carboxylase biotin carboxyl carrier protein